MSVSFYYDGNCFSTCEFLFAEKTIFPNLLTRSINPNVHTNKKVIEIDLIVHLDASGSEVFFQVGALAPDDIPDLFGKYGHATPEVTSGYTGKEGDMGIYFELCFL